MNTQPCHLCSATTPSTRQTPTLFGVRPLCARCRERYRTAVGDAIGKFHLHQQQAPLLAFYQTCEAA